MSMTLRILIFCLSVAVMATCGLVTQAPAQTTTYTTYGDTTYGSDGSFYQTYGNTTYGHSADWQKTTTCTTYPDSNMTFCN